MLKMTSSGKHFLTSKMQKLLGAYLCLLLLVNSITIYGVSASARHFEQAPADNIAQLQNLSLLNENFNASTFEKNSKGFELQLELSGKAHGNSGASLLQNLSSETSPEKSIGSGFISGCNSRRDVEVTQDTRTQLPSGIPVFGVTITNTCLSCSISKILIACGDFSSATFVDPNTFKRIAVNRCLVNNGNPMYPSNTLNFDYSSSFAYPMVPAHGVVSC